MSSAMPTRNLVGLIGFSLSLVAVIGLFFLGSFGAVASKFEMSVTFLCLPGMIVSIVGLFRKPRRLAAWGVNLGIFGFLYLPTLYLSMFVFR